MDNKNIRTPILPAVLLAVMGTINFIMLIGNKFHVYNAWSFFSAMLSIGSIGFLCFALFRKKTDKLFMLAVAAPLAVDVFVFTVNFISYFSSFTAVLDLFATVLFGITAKAAMVIVAYVMTEQALVKFDIYKYEGYVKKFFFAPAVLMGVYQLIHFCIYPSFVSFLFMLLYPAFMLTFAFWLKDPSEKPKAEKTAESREETNAAADGEYGDAYCSIGKHVVLGIVTCGVWYYIWIFRTTKYLNKAPGAEEYSPIGRMFMCMFIPFYQIFWYFNHGKRIDAIAKSKNPNASEVATMCLLFGIFIPFVAYVIMQVKINELCTAKGGNAEPVAVPVSVPAAETSSADELRKYKQLLDEGVITEEEFEAKKKQLLNL